VHLHHRLTTAVLGTALAAALVACGTDGPSTTVRPTGTAGEGMGQSASCVAPYLDDQPPGGPPATAAPTVSPGESLVIYGHWFASTCNDTGGNDPVEPLAPVRLTLKLPDGRAIPLGEHTPSGPDMGFSADVGIPSSASDGSATILSDQSVAQTYRFEIRAKG
jgi:hypothetical protein